jgi:hypothetical protein
LAHGHSATSAVNTSYVVITATAGSGAATNPHTHDITLADTSPAVSLESLVPPYYTLHVMWNGASIERSLSSGFIGMWTGSKASIPAHWDEVTALRGRFVRSAEVTDAVGGVMVHGHTGYEHFHNISIGLASSEANGDLRLSNQVSRNDHTHEALSSTAIVNAELSDNLPPYIDVFFIKFDGTDPNAAPRWFNTYRSA